MLNVSQLYFDRELLRRNLKNLNAMQSDIFSLATIFRFQIASGEANSRIS